MDNVSGMREFQRRIDAMAERVEGMKRWVGDRADEMADAHPGDDETDFHDLAAAEMNGHIREHVENQHDRDKYSWRFDCPVCMAGVR